MLREDYQEINGLIDDLDTALDLVGGVIDALKELVDDDKKFAAIEDLLSDATNAIGLARDHVDFLKYEDDDE